MSRVGSFVKRLCGFIAMNSSLADAGNKVSPSQVFVSTDERPVQIILNLTDLVDRTFEVIACSDELLHEL